MRGPKRPRRPSHAGPRVASTSRRPITPVRPGDQPPTSHGTAAGVSTAEGRTANTLNPCMHVCSRKYLRAGALQGRGEGMHLGWTGSPWGVGDCRLPHDAPPRPTRPPTLELPPFRGRGWPQTPPGFFLRIRRTKGWDSRGRPGADLAPPRTVPPDSVAGDRRPRGRPTARRPARPPNRRKRIRSSPSVAETFPNR